MTSDRIAAAAYAPNISGDRLTTTEDNSILPFREGSGIGRTAGSLEPLRVTHFSHNDQRGGGPLASYRLHRALLDRGADSRMLVMKKHHDDPTVETSVPPWLDRLIETPARVIDRLPLRLYPRRARGVVWSPGWFSRSKARARKVVRNADVLSLYWINGGFLSIREIEALLGLGKPVVWRLSDLWAFTGGCHHAAGCLGYRRACGKCPQLGSRSRNDLSSRLLQAKMRWPMERLAVVSPSRWLADLAARSAVFSDCRIEHITTGIDIDVFSPKPKAEARRSLGLPLDRTLILFGANNGARNPRKGFSHLLDALRQLTAEGRADNVDLVLFGQRTPPSLPFPLPVHMMGSIGDEATKAALFNAIDIFATPSLEENLPNTVIESLACGTPTVAFDVGGTGELVQHQINGYLATPGDSSDFCRGLAFILDRHGEGTCLGEAARDVVVRHHDIRHIAGRYLDLYRELHSAQAQERAA